MFINRYLDKTVKQILKYEANLGLLSDEDLKNKTFIFKERIYNGETLDQILPEAFAVVKEASRRVIGMEHFPVQLMGGISLHKGYIAEMKTGEGKTLVSTCPAYLNALSGKSVYIVTVNDYLAKRDSEQTGKVHRFLGLSVGTVLNEMGTLERKEAYSCDITYVTNNELGFDYLRDNMAMTKEQQVLRGLNYCIIDEADSVLIDEARTPLIISGQSDRSTSLYVAADFLAKKMNKGEPVKNYRKVDMLTGEEIEENGDFIIEEKEKNVHLTAYGVDKSERFFHISNLADPDNIDIQHHINLALKANYIMHRDKDYVVKDNEILIVDEFTGRIMPGRHYSDGLHQAIEAKEQVDIKRESRTLATITFQNFFNKFDKKSGMTGTAKTEEKEFKNTYHMSVIEIATNKPAIRKDYEDAVYKTKKEKYEAIVKAVEESYKKSQPVLVGTITISTSELLSKLLNEKGISHNVLNAKHVEQEAEIVKKAGQNKAVTIATNMAGRGTDIKLDDDSKKAGGLKIIGTERHESRRIDNQLRGRSGRQGDPGESKFYLSLEDDLMRLFGTDNMKQMFEKAGMEEGEEIEHRLLTKTIGNAQKKVENNNYGVREQLIKFDMVNNEQREIIYAERNLLLNRMNVRDIILDMMESLIISVIKNYFKENKEHKEQEFEEMLMKIYECIPVRMKVSALIKLNKTDLIKTILEDAGSLYCTQEQRFENTDELRSLERRILLKEIDFHWMNHLDHMEKLRESISMEAYAGHDPLVEYKLSVHEMFDEMIQAVRKETIKAITHILS